MSHRELNSVVQIIATQAKPAFSRMVAGSGWFPAGYGEGIIITNAHVVNGSEAVFIRMPCAHTTDVRAYVRGISTDLDIAVLSLGQQSLTTVKGLLEKRYGNSAIPTLTIGDSDKFIGKQRAKLETRGYPLGTEYQQVTAGGLSGLKHAKEQVYIVTDAPINPGNSGGPSLEKVGNTVIGMNTMKVKDADLISMLIPSNRVKQVLPYLLDNSENEKQIQMWQQLAQQAYARNNNGGPASMEQVNELVGHLSGVEIDAKTVASAWKEHSPAGHKRAKNNIEQVSFSDWYNKHIKNVHGSHEILEKVLTHLQNGEIDEIHTLRAQGFQQSSCQNCSAGHCPAPGIKLMEGQIPPRVVHYPRLAFRTCNSTGEATLKAYGSPENVVSGVIASDVVKGGLMDRSGLQKYDFIYKVETPEGLFQVDNYGESWREDLQVSMKIADLIHRTNFGEQVILHVCGHCGKKKKVVMDYNFLEHANKPHIRPLEDLQDMPLSRQVVKMAGITMTPLRMNHVMMYRMGEYMDPHRQNEFKIVVADLDVGSPAFHAKNILPGAVLSKINNEAVADSWEGFVEQLQSVKVSVQLESEDGAVLIL